MSTPDSKKDSKQLKSRSLADLENDRVIYGAFDTEGKGAKSSFLYNPKDGELEAVKDAKYPSFRIRCVLGGGIKLSMSEQERNNGMAMEDRLVGDAKTKWKATVRVNDGSGDDTDLAGKFLVIHEAKFRAHIAENWSKLANVCANKKMKMNEATADNVFNKEILYSHVSEVTKRKCVPGENPMTTYLKFTVENAYDTTRKMFDKGRFNLDVFDCTELETKKIMKIISKKVTPLNVDRYIPAGSEVTMHIAITGSYAHPMGVSQKIVIRQIYIHKLGVQKTQGPIDIGVAGAEDATIVEEEASDDDEELGVVVVETKPKPTGVPAVLSVVETAQVSNDQPEEGYGETAAYVNLVGGDEPVDV